MAGIEAHLQTKRGSGIMKMIAASLEGRCAHERHISHATVSCANAAVAHHGIHALVRVLE